MKAFIPIVVVASLAGCGGGGSGGGGTVVTKPGPVVSASPFDTFASFDAAHTAAQAEKQGQFHTAYTDGVTFPDSGTANFSGTYRSILDGAGTPTVVIGLASMTTDFAANTLTGGVTDFVGQIDGGATAFYGGDVTFLSGAIGKDAALPDSRPNDLRFDYAGTLTGNGQTIELSGSNDMGKFLRTPITGIEATGTSTATINGGAVSDEMSLYLDID